jgi:hypothetical protein
MCDQFGYILSARRIVRACAAIVNTTLVVLCTSCRPRIMTTAGIPERVTLYR